MARSELNPTARLSTPKTLDERPSRFAPNWPSRSLPSIGNRVWGYCGRFTKIVCAPDRSGDDDPAVFCSLSQSDDHVDLGVNLDWNARTGRLID
jgi:hypothetical protein